MRSEVRDNARRIDRHAQRLERQVRRRQAAKNAAVDAGWWLILIAGPTLFVLGCLVDVLTKR